MFYINTDTNEYPITEGFIRSLYPNTSFTDPFVAPEPFAFVAESLKPDIMNHTIQTYREIHPVEIEGKYYRSWEVVSKFKEYTDKDGVLRSVEEQEAAALQSEIDMRWAAVRADRNSFLAATDWWVTKAAETGSLITPEQQAYRQALRDITLQEDPFNIVWPTEPQ